jgi:hypothetical protein
MRLSYFEEFSVLTMGSSSDWLRELKEEFGTLDPWNRRAFLYSAALLPKEERKFFLKDVRCGTLLEELIVDWAKR